MSGVRLLKSLYTFKAAYKSTLSFKEEELFVDLALSGVEEDRNWYYVVSGSGNVGYVPRNYVTSVSLNPADTLDLVSAALSKLKKHSRVSEEDRREAVDKLKEIKLSLTETLGALKKSSKEGSKDSLSSINSSKKRAAPPPPKHNQLSASSGTSHSPRPTTTTDQSTQSPRPSSEQSRNSPRPSTSSFEIVQEASVSSTSHNSPKAKARPKLLPLAAVPGAPSLTKMSSDEVVTVVYKQPPDNCHSNALELVELVRRQTNISYEATQSLLNSILQTLISSNKDLNVLVPSLQHEFKSQLFETESDIKSSHDYTDLVSLFDELTKTKEDDQQRNWMLHEDEDSILKNLHRLCSTLQNASRDICLHVLARYKYFYVQNLVDYFQMETRWSIRKVLIETYTLMCSLDPNIVSLMLVSVLPLELAQDMFDNATDMEHLKHCCVLLTVLFSQGEAVPVHYKERQLGDRLVTFLLDNIESSADKDVEDDLADTFMGLLASYNLQFQSTSDNIVLKCLSSASNAKIFTEKLLLLLNREDDPTEVIGPRKGVNSVHKLVLDVFSSEGCIQHFYTNDLMVLIDIIARQLSDLGPGIER